MAFSLHWQVATTLSFLVAVTHQTPIRTTISTTFNPQCFKDAYYLNVQCLVLLWDVSRHPVYTKEGFRTSSTAAQKTNPNNQGDGTITDDENKKKKKKKCGKKRLIDCPKYREVIEDDFQAPDINCKAIRRCNKDVMNLINKCSNDKHVELVWETLWNTAKDRACERNKDSSDSD